MRDAILPGRQKGLSLIELMVALTLGLMITTAMGYILIGSRSTYRTQDASARVQDTGRFALEFIGRQLRYAGRVDISPLASNTNVVLGADAIRADSTGTLLITQYQAAEDCNGAAVAGMVVNQISLDANRQLQCLGNGGGATQPFAEEVEEIQFRYTTGNGSWTTTPTAPVRAVEVCLRVRSAGNGAVNATQIIRGCDGANIANPGDTRLRRIFTSVFALRNNINTLPTP